MVLPGFCEDTGRLHIAHTDAVGLVIDVGTLSVSTLRGLVSVPSRDVPFDVSPSSPLLSTPTSSFVRGPRRVAWTPHPAFRPLWPGAAPRCLPRLTLSRILSVDDPSPRRVFDGSPTARAFAEAGVHLLPPGRVSTSRAPSVSCGPTSGPTLASSIGSHPVYSPPSGGLAFLSVQQEAALMDLPATDPRMALLCSLGPGRAHAALGAGVSVRSSASIFLRIRHVLPAGRITVATAFSGADLFCAGLTAIGVPHRVLLASETRPHLRDFLRKLHPHAGVFRDATSAAATGYPHRADLVLWGFPCVKFSTLNRSVSERDLDREVHTLDHALDYVRLHPPRAFVLENVVGLKRRFPLLLHRICELLRSACPSLTWYCHLDRPDRRGGPSRRPRLFLVGLAEAPA